MTDPEIVGDLSRSVGGSCPDDRGSDTVEGVFEALEGDGGDDEQEGSA